MSLSEAVIKNGCCIGCGICASTLQTPYKIIRTEAGLREAVLVGVEDEKTSADFEKLCPFGEKSLNENELADIFFPDAPKYKKYIGKYNEAFAGNVADESLRAKASSGGISRWLEAKLLADKLIDGVVHVVTNTNASGEPLFKYAVVTDLDELQGSARSAYYPTSMDGVIRQIRTMEGSFLFTGVPCFIKALRLLSLQDSEIREKIKYTLGIVCGHMKSEAYAELIGWQLGTKPDELESIDFRGKAKGGGASIKLNIVTSKDVKREEISGKLFGTSYSLGLFKPKACDFCDDVLAETADISIGDAWLDKYVYDSRGTSMVVVRNAELLDVLQSGVQHKELALDYLSGSDVLKSQEGGLRHRNEGLACRIQSYRKSGLWVPVKRVQPDWRTRFILRNRLYLLRHRISQVSHEAFVRAKKLGSLDSFLKEMAPLVKEHNKIIKKSDFFKRIRKKLIDIKRRWP